MSVIGQGTYGCIHKPSLKCNKSNTKYQNKVSKIFKNEEANKEIEEYKIISRFDKKKDFFLGEPLKCSPSNTPANIESIKKCKNGQQLVDRLKSYSLLVMEDGGINLQKFADKVELLENDEVNRNKIELFWIEAHRILIGIREFLINDVVHHDLKPQNIVYNENLNRLNFIDFGLMDSKTNLFESAKNDKYPFPHYHWSFPLEIMFVNKRDFLNFVNIPKQKKGLFFDHLFDSFNEESRDFNLSFTTYLNETFATREIDKSIVVSQAKDILLNFKISVFYDFMITNYDVILNKFLNTIDIYGIGIAFMYVLNRCEILLDINLSNQFQNLFKEMLNPNLLRRIEINELIEKYEYILETCNILEKHNKMFVNHQLVTRRGTSSISTLFNHLTASIIKNTKLSFNKQQELLEREPNASIHYKKNQKNSKNPKISKISKISKIKTNRKKTIKLCPEGKVLNAKTNRCIKSKTAKIVS
jgi:serine/threonine protein kinase